MLEYRTLYIDGPEVAARRIILDEWVEDGWEPYLTIRLATSWHIYLKRSTPDDAIRPRD